MVPACQPTKHRAMHPYTLLLLQMFRGTGDGHLSHVIGALIAICHRVHRPRVRFCCSCEQRPAVQQEPGRELQVRLPVPAVQSPAYRAAGVRAQAYVHVLGLLPPGRQQMPHVQVTPPSQEVPPPAAT